MCGSGFMATFVEKTMGVMRNKLCVLVLALALFGWVVGWSAPKEASGNHTAVATVVGVSAVEWQPDSVAEVAKIQGLIRDLLNRVDTGRIISLLPMLSDSNGMVVGFDLERHEANLTTLRASGFFAEEFVEHYNQMILTLDRQVKNNEFGEFSIEDMPPFSFASGVNAWCNCQDIPYNEPNPWDYVEVEVLAWQANRVKLNWKWGNLPSVVGVGWREFRYGFVVVKEDGEWKIASLAGFSL